MTTKEEWKQIRDFPDYAVSNIGRIKRIIDSPKNKKRAGLLLKTRTGRGGYIVIVLSVNGIKKIRQVHGLVLEAFGSPRPSGFQCHHKDYIRDHNNIENLEWVTRKQNVGHAIKSGNKKARVGEKSNLARFKTGEVYLIKKMIASKKFTLTFIGKMFRACTKTIHHIKVGNSWKHISYS